MEKTYDFIDSEYKAQDVTIFVVIDTTHLDSGVYVLTEQHPGLYSRYTNKAWVSHYAICHKHPRLEIGLRNV